MRRIRDKPDVDVRVELAQEAANKRGLARPDFASDDGKPGAVHHAELKHGKGQSMVRPPIDQFRVRQDRKWFFSKPVERLVHRPFDLYFFAGTDGMAMRAAGFSEIVTFYLQLKVNASNGQILDFNLDIIVLLVDL